MAQKNPLTKQTVQRLHFTVQGQVQGVGFRPFVFLLAHTHHLTGTVANTSAGLVIEVQGYCKQLEAFAHTLHSAPPPLARITSCDVASLPPLKKEQNFSIIHSANSGKVAALISPDTGLCADCCEEMHTQGNRRYLYPFTNCTNCGPRYTITHSIPYDRLTTSMGCFPMCPDCTAEYQNPRNRRFHAQPNACPVCGPTVWLCPSAPPSAPSTRECAKIQGTAALQETARQLLQGKIVAIKGLGGFHLACDAFNSTSVLLLRKRKQRPHKPFALMVPDVATARHIVQLTPAEEVLLQSRERPIVLCRTKNELKKTFQAISRDTNLLGIMLPYTPLHQSLFILLQEEKRHFSKDILALVMTSGNPKGLPICLGNREALQQLHPFADSFLLHNRDILIRVDDSVVQHIPEIGTLFFRRARGYVPTPIELPLLPGSKPEDLPCLAATGADLKNTASLNRQQYSFTSQYIGDMENLQTVFFHKEITNHLKNLLQVTPEKIVTDKHPAYESRRMAEESGLPFHTVQHHTAHAFAVLAEHMCLEPALAVTFDGTGYGDDATLWGGEWLLIKPQQAAVTRLAHASPLPLPGGEQAIKEPWRIAHALLWELGFLEHPESDCTKGGYPLPWLPKEQTTARYIPLMLEDTRQCPATTSIGRLFDAVAALLGICTHVTYEGQAAIRLEQHIFFDVATTQATAQANTQETAPYQQAAPITHATTSACADPSTLHCPFLPANENTPFVLDTRSLFRQLAHQMELHHAHSQNTLTQKAALHFMQQQKRMLAQAFHAALCNGTTNLICTLAQEHKVQKVAFSGGCFQNSHLVQLLHKSMTLHNLTPLFHKTLPPNDSCVSLGQLFYELCKSQMTKKQI